MTISAAPVSAAPTGAAPSVLSPQQARIAAFEQKFRASLDEESGMIQVAGETFHPADVLQSLAPVAYQAALGDFVQERLANALARACDEFPAPIAIAIDRALNCSSNEHERLMHFRDAAEALILVLLAVVVAECRGKGVKLRGLTFSNPSGNQEALTAKKLLTDSVAHRLAMLEGILTSLAGHGNLVCVSRIAAPAVRQLKGFKCIRNDFSHYQAMAEPEAALVCQDLREQLADAMLAFEWLAETELVVFDRAVTGKPNVARFEVHNGNSQNKPYKERTLAPAALVKCLGLTAEQLHRPLFHWTGDVFEATLYLHSALTTKGHRRHIWLLKRTRGADSEFEVAGERELCVVAGSATAVELKVLEDLFA
jgi:hypothetical protein